MMAAQLAQPADKPAAIKGVPKAKVVPLTQSQREAAPAAAAPEIEKVTVYLPKPVYRFIKQTALELERRPHDLLMQGIDLMLAQHGKSLKDFNK
jgi:hypothetical protein